MMISDEKTFLDGNFGLSRRTLIGAAGVSASVVAAEALGVFGSQSASAAILWVHPLATRGTITKYWANPGHNGIDFDLVTKNNRVYSVAAGQVEEVLLNDPTYGVKITINHGPNVPGGPIYRTYYGHMQTGSVQVAYGDWISRATWIGNTGETGVAQGDHLHLGYTINGVQTDPIAFATYPLPGSAGSPIVNPPSGAPGYLTEVRPASASNFIPGNTGMLLNPSFMSAVAMPTSTFSAQLLLAQEGVLYHAYRNGTSWEVGSTGLAASPTSFSAVYMNGNWPTAMFIENSKLYQALGTPTGWQKLWTGQIFVGQISAVNMGGQWPTVMLVQDGLLWRIFGDATGWHLENTGLAASGQISAVNMGGTKPQVMMIENGYLYQMWFDSGGWHKASTGQNLIGKISATNSGGQWPTVMLDQGGFLYRVYGDSTGWHTAPTYVGTSGGRVTAVALTNPAPMVYKIG
jgi:murein DD-endopeptidase